MRSPAKLLIAALVLSAATLTAHAGPITYDFTLTDAGKPIDSGYGSFTIASSPASSGLSLYDGLFSGPSRLDALSFTVHGDTFTLAGDPGASVLFFNGNLAGIGFFESMGSLKDPDTLTTAFLRYTFTDGRHTASGVIGDVAPVPEPGSLALLGTGLISGAASLYRRRFGFTQA